MKLLDFLLISDTLPWKKVANSCHLTVEKGTAGIDLVGSSGLSIGEILDMNCLKK